MARDAAEPKVVFTPRERKINNFSGKRDSDATVDEFIEDIELTLKTRPTSDIEKVNFIISHMEGPAREEVRYRSTAEKKMSKDMLDILREVFGDRGTISELLSDFYQCIVFVGRFKAMKFHDDQITMNNFIWHLNLWIFLPMKLFTYK